MEKGYLHRIKSLSYKEHYRLYLAILLLTFFLAHLARNSFLGIHVDEANWWMQTKYLQLGYFYHPPFIVYELFIITKIFGDGPLALRLGSLFFTTASLYLVFLLVNDIFKSEKLALITTLMISLLPLTNYWVLIAHQDAPLIFFWLLTIFFLWRAMVIEKKHYWYLAGLSSGAMLLTNLRSTLLFLGALLFLLTTRKQRNWLKKKEPYLALLIAGAIFSPTFLWYASHHFEPLTYQLSNRPGFLHNPFPTYILGLVKHAGWEALALTPFIYLFSLYGLIYGGYLGFVTKDQRFRYLFWLSAPMIILFGLTGGPPYWAFPGHTVALIAAANSLPLLPSKIRLRLSRKVWIPLFVGLFMLLPLACSFTFCYFYATTSTIHNGWKELAETLETVKENTEAGGELYLSGPYYFIPSEVCYYDREDFQGYTLAFRVYENKVMAENSNYSPWIPLETLVGKDMIFVDEKLNPDGYETPVSYWIEKLNPYFQRVENPIILVEYRGEKTFRTFYIFVCHGFKGTDSRMDRKGEVREYINRT